MATAPTDWLTIDAAAARLGCSTRTLQRRVASGTIQAQHREDGRTLVEVATPCPTPVADAALVERLERQSDDSNRIAALAALASEQTALAYRDRLTTVEAALSDSRSTARTWRNACAVAASVTVSAVVMAGYLAGRGVATERQMSDIAMRLEVAESDRRAAARDLDAMTAERQASDKAAAALRERLDSLQALGFTASDECPTSVALSTP